MLLLDTSFLIDYESELAARQVGPARTVLRQRPLEIVAVSLISVGEFAEGFSDAREVESFLSHFKVVTLSRVIAYRAAALQASLPQRLGENDAWIVATALVYNAELIGRERAFTRVPHLHYTQI